MPTTARWLGNKGVKINVLRVWYGELGVSSRVSSTCCTVSNAGKQPSNGALFAQHPRKATLQRRVVGLQAGCDALPSGVVTLQSRLVPLQGRHAHLHWSHVPPVTDPCYPATDLNTFVSRVKQPVFSALHTVLDPKAPRTLPVTSPYWTAKLPVFYPLHPRTGPRSNPSSTRYIPVLDPKATRFLPVTSPYSTPKLPVLYPLAPRTRPRSNPSLYNREGNRATDLGSPTRRSTGRPLKIRKLLFQFPHSQRRMQ